MTRFSLRGVVLDPAYWGLDAEGNLYYGDCKSDYSSNSLCTGVPSCKEFWDGVVDAVPLTSANVSAPPSFLMAESVCTVYVPSPGEYPGDDGVCTDLALYTNNTLQNSSAWGNANKAMNRPGCSTSAGSSFPVGGAIFIAVASAFTLYLAYELAKCLCRPKQNSVHGSSVGVFFQSAGGRPSSRHSSHADGSSSIPYSSLAGSSPSSSDLPHAVPSVP